MSLADTFGKRKVRPAGNGGVPDMAAQNGAKQTAPTDAHTARERHFAAALAIEADASQISESGQKALSVITQALELARSERAEALAQADADCRATEETLVRAARDHINATEIYVNLAKSHADVVRADGDKLLGVIREADERLAAKTQAILHAQKPQEDQPAQEPEQPTEQPALGNQEAQ